MKKTMVLLFIVGILLIEGLAHLDIYFILLDIFSITNRSIIFGLQVLINILWLSFVLSTLLSARFNNMFVRGFYKLASTWLGFLLYYFIAACIYAFINFAFEASHAISGPQPYGIILFGLATLVTLYGFYHGQKSIINRVEIRIEHLPEFWINKKIVFISDVHLGHVRMKNFAAKVTKEINDLNPDMVLIGGDLYDGLKVDTLGIIEPFKNLKALSSTYFITGNHDGFSEIATEQDLESVEKIGIQVLNNRLVNLNGLQLIGVDYRETDSAEKFNDVLSGIQINPSMPSILLKHIPNYIEITEKFGISLQLSGHTHRAQVWPLSHIPPLIYKKFAYGLSCLNKTQVYTSSGVGTFGPPMRVGTNCELVLITLNR